MSIPLIYQDEVAETFIVQRTQRIHIHYDEDVSYFCHLSKNLWNQAHHIIEGYYKKYHTIPSYKELDAILNKKSYYKNNPDFDNYHKIGSATAQQILKVYIGEWIDYFKARKEYPINPEKYTGEPQPPGYKKKDGEFILIFTNQQIKFYENKIGNVFSTFPKKIDNKPSKLKDLKILLGNVNHSKMLFNDLDPYLLNRIMKGNFDIVRIVPKGTGYWVEIVYDQEVLKDNSIYNEIYHLDEDIIQSIDLGVNNIVTITDNIGNRPIVINSDIVKEMNQWYNKRKAELQYKYDRQILGCKLPEIEIDKNGNVIKDVDNSNMLSNGKVKRKFKIGFIGEYIKDRYGQNIGCKLPDMKNKNIIGPIIRYITNKTGKKLDILTENRNNIIIDALHKISRILIEHALNIKSKTISFTRNPFWKQNVNMGKRNNQNFVNIPHKKLIDMTRYKAQEYGIDVIDLTEEYTSKCSFPDTEDICFHTKYMGERIYRGLFVASKGFKINADVNGSYNNLRNTAEKIFKNLTKFDKVYPKFDILDIYASKDAIEGVAVHGLVPKRINVSDLMTKSYESLGFIKNVNSITN